MRALDKHRIANRHPQNDDLEIFGLDPESLDGDYLEIFGAEAGKEPSTFDKIVSAASTLAQAAPELRQGIERTIDPNKARQQQQYQQLPPAYYQQPQKKGGMPEWAVYALGAVGVLGLGFVGYKVVKG